MPRGAGWIIALAIAVGMILIWTFTPMRALVDPRSLLAAAEDLRSTTWGIVLVPVVFVVLAVAMVPMSLLRWTTVVAFDPFIAIPCMLIGALGATFIGHAIGERVGAERMQRIGGSRFDKIRARLQRTGVLGIAAVRQIPLGPSMIVNAVAGAVRVRRREFLAGTLVSMIPSVIVMVLAGASVRAWLLG